jgi:hypothetical protein
MEDRSTPGHVMADLTVLAAIVAFFGMSSAFVAGCARLRGE